MATGSTISHYDAKVLLPSLRSVSLGSMSWSSPRTVIDLRSPLLQSTLLRPTVFDVSDTLGRGAEFDYMKLLPPLSPQGIEVLRRRGILEKILCKAALDETICGIRNVSTGHIHCSPTGNA